MQLMCAAKIVTINHDAKTASECPIGAAAEAARTRAPFNDKKVGEHRRHAVEGARLCPNACALMSARHGKKRNTIDPA